MTTRCCLSGDDGEEATAGGDPRFLMAASYRDIR